MESHSPLRSVATTTLDGSGAGRARFGPPRPNMRWIIRSVTVTTASSATAQPQAFIELDGQVLSATWTGDSDTDSQLGGAAGVTLYTGSEIIARWVGGVPGATATVSYYGEQITGVD